MRGYCRQCGLEYKRPSDEVSIEEAVCHLEHRYTHCSTGYSQITNLDRVCIRVLTMYVKFRRKVAQTMYNLRPDLRAVSVDDPMRLARTDRAGGYGRRHALDEHANPGARSRRGTVGEPDKESQDE